ncbi:hypothetical protein Tco_0065773 [Tanacetum coccineum]
MCKAYGGEPSIDLFRGFFNLYLSRDWLTFAKRPEADVPIILLNPITHIEDWKCWFFYVQDTIVPSVYLELLSKENRLEKRTFKDKIPPSISETLMYQCLARYPINVQSFLDPILFLVGLKTSWEHSPQNLAIFVGGKEMAFRNFMFTKDVEDISFLPHEPYPGFGVGSPSTSINSEPPLLEVKPLDSVNPDQFVKNTTDLGDSLVRKEMPVVGSGSIAERMKIGGTGQGISSPAPMEAKAESFAYPTIFYDEGLPVALELQTAIDCHLMVSNITPLTWRGHLDNQSEVLREREKARDKKCGELKAKCEAAMTDFHKNLAVMVLRQKIVSLLAEVRGHRGSTPRRNQVVKYDRAEVVSKVVPYVAMELVHSDEMTMLVGRLVSSTIFYGRCVALEEVAKMKEPFDLVKVKEVTTYPSASIEALLSKKPKSLRRPTPTKTNAPAPSAPSQQANPSYAPIMKPLSAPLKV